MSRSFSLTARSSGLRTLVTAIALLVPATAFALDNGNLGTPQNDCERAATSDYYANLESCDKNLAGDAQSIAQCKQDFSYDYLDAIAACKTAALTPGGKLHGNFGAVVDGPVFQSTTGQPVKKGGQMFGRG